MKFHFDRFLLFAFIGIIVLVCISCQRNEVPKPHAYFRIDFPEKKYQLYNSICPFIFDYPVYGIIGSDRYHQDQPCLFNINFPEYKGTIHLTYHPVNRNIDILLDDDWNFVYKKIALKADGVDPYNYVDYENKVYGTVYDIKGNAGSPLQFFVTDSVDNFLRGSLYFNVKPNYDSLMPVISFFREDIIHLMETIRWKE
ncbi:MAG: gliding motility lipoprotein GldD [Bacteroidales bacterium]|jgi:gliding motility-associated lipoprotein GldD|nr:gliding motility lipoprotein GldD [Bacteroidales bacterium]